MLESHRRICKSKWNNTPLKGPIAGPECGLPFITLCNSNKMIGMAEVDLSVYRVDTVGKVILFAVYAVRNECIQPIVCFSKFEVN